MPDDSYLYGGGNRIRIRHVVQVERQLSVHEGLRLLNCKKTWHIVLLYSV